MFEVVCENLRNVVFEPEARCRLISSGVSTTRSGKSASPPPLPAAAGEEVRTSHAPSAENSATNAAAKTRVSVPASRLSPPSMPKPDYHRLRVIQGLTSLAAMDRRSWTLVFAVGAIWGASFLFIEIGIRDMSPAVVAWARVALGAAFLVPFAWYRGVLRVPGAGVGLIVFLAATQVAVPFVLIGEGQKDITSSLSGILVASTPLWTALLAIRLDPSERSEGIQLWGVLAGLARRRPSPWGRPAREPPLS